MSCLIASYRLGVHGCCTWVEVVIHYYADYLSEYSDSALVIRAPTANAKFTSDDITFETFALSETYEPSQVLFEIIEGGIEFNPVALEKDIKKIEEHHQKRKAAQAKDASDAEDGGEDDEAAEDATSTAAKLPPFQPAFERLLRDMENALVDQTYDKAETIMRILKDIAPVVRVSKKKDCQGYVLSTTTSNYIRNSHAKAKAKAKKKKNKQPTSSDSSSSSSDAGSEVAVENID